MPTYYVSLNEETNGEHWVHRAGCTFVPAENQRFALGDFHTCTAAVRKAKDYYARANGCFYCSRECHGV